MALTATVTKGAVTYAQPKLHNLTFHLSLMDGATEVLSRDISYQYHEGTTPAAAQVQIAALCQAEINQYKSAKAIYDSTALTNAVAAIQAALTV
jgi:hypothetical protein